VQSDRHHPESTKPGGNRAERIRKHKHLSILDPKRETTLMARFAMKGAAVHRLADGGFIVAQWGLTRHCADFAALVGFARQMGVI
jgi:hypothetical protein